VAVRNKRIKCARCKERDTVTTGERGPASIYCDICRYEVKAEQNRARVQKMRDRRRRARAAGPAYQAHPDEGRYQEIQKALADRGYFKGEVNGQWGDDSVDALKRFQADQKLPDDGKINSLSLIGLGLGAKHNDSSAASPSSASAMVRAASKPTRPARSSLRPRVSSASFILYTYNATE